MSQRTYRRLSATRILARLLLSAACLALALLMVFHQRVPDVAGLGLIVDNLTPWMGLGVPLLALLVLVVRGRATFIALLVPTVVWAMLFLPAVLPGSSVQAGQQTLSVATQNVHEDAISSATTLAATGTQVITLQELGPGQAEQVTQVLAGSHPYHYTVSTVGLWSAYPLVNAEPLDLGLGWDRALRVDVQAPRDTVRVYAVHAASARPTGHAERDEMLLSLAENLRADPSARIVAAGDFNATSTDRHFAPVSEALTEVHFDSWGLALTWPREPFAMLGIDHVLTRGASAASVQRLSAGDSDHLALSAVIELAN